MLTLKQVQHYTGPGGSTQQVHHKHIRGDDMLKWLKNLFTFKHHGDLSKHRLHTLKYEDLCK